jgi:Ser/Thr protein kinase RdoA (MazF antagonist)
MKYRENFIFHPAKNNDSNISKQINKTRKEFYELMKSYNATIYYNDYNFANVFFKKEEDIKRVIEFLQPYIDAFWVASALENSN